MKFVIDTNTYKYINLRVNEFFWDLSKYSFQYLGTGHYSYIDPYIFIDSADTNTTTVYIDNVSLTEET